MSYEVTQLSAADAIARKGQTVTLAGDATTTYDTATATTTTTAAYSKTAKAVLLPLSPYRAANDSRVTQGDEQMLLAALDTAGDVLTQPPSGTTVTLADGTKRTLIAADPLRPDGTALLYDCIVRGNG